MLGFFFFPPATRQQLYGLLRFSQKFSFTALPSGRGRVLGAGHLVPLSWAVAMGEWHTGRFGVSRAGSDVGRGF